MLSVAVAVDDTLPLTFLVRCVRAAGGVSESQCSPFPDLFCKLSRQGLRNFQGLRQALGILNIRSSDCPVDLPYQSTQDFSGPYFNE